MTRFSPDDLAQPIVVAPMAGGPSTPALAAAVSGAGGLGFLGAGYLALEVLAERLAQLTARLGPGVPYGVNLFAPPGHGSGAGRVADYAETLRAEAEAYGAPLGDADWDDDRYDAKVDLLCARPVPVVSTTFGCPSTADVQRLQEVGTAVWITVTTVDEALAARAAGADALVVQGVEAGGHRSGFDDARPSELGLLPLLQLVRAAVGAELPLVATGGLATGEGVAAVLAAGAAAAQLGTAFLRCPEAGTTPAHADRLVEPGAVTGVTRAFTGRSGRGVVNRFQREHGADAPSAYPEVHHLTAAVRAAARARGDADAFQLWAGQAHALARAVPAAELVAELADQARAALRTAADRFGPPTG